MRSSADPVDLGVQSGLIGGLERLSVESSLNVSASVSRRPSHAQWLIASDRLVALPGATGGTMTSGARAWWR
jgi:hypothetical protein